MQINENNIFNTREAAEYLNSTPGTLKSWRGQNKGPPFCKPQGKIYYLKEDLDKWIKDGQQN